MQDVGFRVRGLRFTVYGWGLRVGGGGHLCSAQTWLNLLVSFQVPLGSLRCDTSMLKRHTPLTTAPSMTTTSGSHSALPPPVASPLNHLGHGRSQKSPAAPHGSTPTSPPPPNTLPSPPPPSAHSLRASLWLTPLAPAHTLHPAFQSFASA